MKVFSIILAGILPVTTAAQMNIGTAGFYIADLSVMAVKGDLKSAASIEGTGRILFNGTSVQQLNLSGQSVGRIELDNPNGISLQEDGVIIRNGIQFISGKIQLNSFDLTAEPGAVMTGANTTSFISINGTGRHVKKLNTDVTGVELPVGQGGNFRPAYLTTSGCGYTLASFRIGVEGSANAANPPRIRNYLGTNWPVSHTGISGGTVTLAAKYLDPVDVTGVESTIAGYFYNGTNWSSSGETHDYTANTISAVITSGSGVLTGMNKFLAVGSRVFLQGAYDSLTGLMRDNLRLLPLGPSAVVTNFPQDDPYRTTGLQSSFAHVNNPQTESITGSSVMAAQPVPGNNIVDWVFLQLRNLSPSPGNTVLQTRSALLQRDGDIVDIDGVSPVTFNVLPDGNYVLTVRHRNHLGISLDQAFPKLLTETGSTAFTDNVIDFRVATDQVIYGTAAAYNTVGHPTLGVVNLLWGGNARHDSKVAYNGLQNDKDFILGNGLGGNPASSISPVYSVHDVNMNRAIRFTGLNNDKDFLVNFVFRQNVSSAKIQQIPN